MKTEPNDECDKALQAWKCLPETDREYRGMLDAEFSPLNCLDHGFRAGWAAMGKGDPATEKTEEEGQGVPIGHTSEATDYINADHIIVLAEAIRALGKPHAYSQAGKAKRVLLAAIARECGGAK